MTPFITEIHHFWKVFLLVRKTYKEYNNNNSNNNKGHPLGNVQKKIKFDHANKWYMHNPASVLENDTHKLPWDCNIRTDPLISSRRPDLIIINKKKKKKKKGKDILQNCRLWCPGWPRNKTERMWIEG